MKQAMGMLLTGRRVSAEEGKQLGFVNDVVPEGQALEGAKAWAAQILECAPLSVRGSKQAAMAGISNAAQLLKLTADRQAIMKDAWLTATGHKRPMKAGLPLDEAKVKAAEIDAQIKALLR